jgi:hypothetical protein
MELPSLVSSHNGLTSVMVPCPVTVWEEYDLAIQKIREKGLGCIFLSQGNLIPEVSGDALVVNTLNTKLRAHTSIYIHESSKMNKLTSKVSCKLVMLMPSVDISSQEI